MNTLDILKILVSAFPNQNIPIQTIVVYESFLKNIDLDILQAAISDLINEKDFFPSIHQIKEKTAIKILNKNNILVLTPEEAWQIVQPKLSNNFNADGSIKTKKFNNDLIDETMNCLGWQNIAMLPSAQVQSNFIKTYKNVVAKKIDTLVKHYNTNVLESDLSNKLLLNENNEVYDE